MLGGFMRQTLLIAIATFFLCAICEAQTTITFHSYYDDKRYEFKVTSEMLEGSPTWSDGEDYPPLSPRRAFEAATSLLSRFIPNVEKWHKREIRLFPIDRQWNPINGKWIYVVEFGNPVVDETNKYDG